MTTISTHNKIITLINEFTVEPENQQKVVDLLTEATEQVMNKLPGFVSANIHKSLDGTKVINYAQWRSKEDFEAIFQKPEAKAHMEKAFALAKVEPKLYEVAFVDHA